MSKTLQDVRSDMPTKEAMIYTSAMEDYNRGVKGNIYEMGTLKEKIDFVRSALTARIAGAKLFKFGKQPVDIPSIGEDQTGRLTFGTEPVVPGMFSYHFEPIEQSDRVAGQQSPQESASAPAAGKRRYEEAARTLGIDLGAREAAQKNTGESYDR